MIMGGMGDVRDLVGEEWLEGIEVMRLAAAVISSIKSELLAGCGHQLNEGVRHRGPRPLPIFWNNKNKSV